MYDFLRTQPGTSYDGNPRSTCRGFLVVWPWVSVLSGMSETYLNDQMNHKLGAIHHILLLSQNGIWTIASSELSKSAPQLVLYHQKVPELTLNPLETATILIYIYIYRYIYIYVYAYMYIPFKGALQGPFKNQSSRSWVGFKGSKAVG